MKPKPADLPGYRWTWHAARPVWVLEQFMFIGVDDQPLYMEVGEEGSDLVARAIRKGVADWKEGKHPAQTEPEAVAGYRWIWYPSGGVWQLCQNRDTKAFGKHCFTIGNQGSSQVNEVIRVVREAAAKADVPCKGKPDPIPGHRWHSHAQVWTLYRDEDDYFVGVRGSESVRKAYKAAAAPPLEESVVVDDPEMPDLEPAEPVPSVREPAPVVRTTGALPPGTMIQILEDLPEYQEGYARGKAVAEKELEAALADQVRETNRLAANIEATERELDATKAKLAQEQTLKHEAHHALTGALNARRTLEDTHNSNLMGMGMGIVVLLMLIVWMSYMAIGCLHQSNTCRESLAEGIQLATRAESKFDPMRKAASDLYDIMKPMVEDFIAFKKLKA